MIVMTTIAIKKQIHDAIDIIESEQVLKAIHMILNAELKHSKDVIKPFTLEEFYDRNEQSQKDIKKGKLVEHKDVKAKFSGKK